LHSVINSTAFLGFGRGLMKKIIKKLHLYLALILCIPLILQGLSGSVMVFREQISNAILNYEYDLAEGEMASKDLIIEAATQKAGQEFSFTSLKASEQKNSFAKVRFAKNGEKKPTLEVIVDPVSLNILEVNNLEKNFFRLTKKFHENLFISEKIGKNIVGFYGLTMLFMALSGLFLWWPKSGMLKRALTFKFADSGKKFYRDMHGSVGFWLMIPLLANSITGIYLVYFRNKESSKLWHGIHDGSAFGLALQIIVFVVGLAPILFSITGISLWWIKRKARA
jgi:uncharacterized iron-regulated membrane protein